MSVVIVGMLDEREEALKLIKERIEEQGHKTILIDVSIGTGAIKPSLAADIRCEEVAHLAGGTIEEIKSMLAKEREKATSIMAEGLTKKVLRLYKDGELQGIIAIAGMTGTFLSLKAMEVLPFGVPKLLISSVAAMPAHGGSRAEYFGLRDITVMHTVVVNPLVIFISQHGRRSPLRSCCR